MRTAVSTDRAPRAIGPYSQAVRAGAWLLLSGQIPLDPDTGELVDGGIEAETHQVMRNLGAVVEAAGLSFEHIVRCTIYLVDLGEFAVVNDVYGSYFSAPAPARTTIEVSKLPRGARVEIDAIAVATPVA